MTTQPPDTTADLMKKSVTALDVGSVSNGVVNLIIPLWPSQYVNTQALPPTPPAYWTPQRDDVLRSTIHHEAMWAAALSIAITKTASKSFEVKSDIPRRAKSGRELLLYADGRTAGYTQFIYKHLRDFLTTDNGSFVEIIRATKSWSSSIIGLRHLDSRRCQRTGDPDIPLLYRDRRGQYHELQDHQVMIFSDMPDPSETYYGVGQCAATRAYPSIYKLAGLERYISEKITGLRPLAIYIVNGMVQRQIEGAIESAKEAQIAQGVAAYMGAVMVGIPADKPPQVATIPLAELPDRFQRKEEFDIAILTYADNLGLDPQELQPLSGAALGTGAQSEVLHDKASGKGLIAWQQEWTHKINEQILPDLTEFLFIERDYRDMQLKATISKTRADAYGVMSDKGFILPEQGTALLVDADELPKEFLEQIQARASQEESISDTEKPDAEAPEKTPEQQQQAADLQQTQAQIPPPGQKQPAAGAGATPEKQQQPPPQPTAKELRALKEAPHDGAMVALFLPLNAAQRLTTPSWPIGAEPIPPADMHITLAYLGKALELPFTQEHLQNVVSSWLAECASMPLQARLSGVGRFTTPDDQERTPVYASIDAPDLTHLQHMLVKHLQAASIPVSTEHGFTPHITLAYLPKDEPIPADLWELKSSQVTFPGITIAWEGQRSLLVPPMAAAHKAASSETAATPEKDATGRLFADHSERTLHTDAADDLDPVAQVETTLGKAQRLYARLRKRKELQLAVAQSVLATAMKHLVGQHSQKRHGLRGAVDTIDANSPVVTQAKSTMTRTGHSDVEVKDDGTHLTLTSRLSSKSSPMRMEYQIHKDATQFPLRGSDARTIIYNKAGKTVADWEGVRPIQWLAARKVAAGTGEITWKPEARYGEYSYTFAAKEAKETKETAA